MESGQGKSSFFASGPGTFIRRNTVFKKNEICFMDNTHCIQRPPVHSDHFLRHQAWSLYTGLTVHMPTFWCESTEEFMQGKSVHLGDLYLVDLVDSWYDLRYICWLMCLTILGLYFGHKCHTSAIS